METTFKAFDTGWDEDVLSIEENPSDKTLQSLYRMKIRDSEQLKTVLTLYVQDIEQQDFRQSIRS